jgi:menaquinone-dependent protoporphyrinogen oxidase
VLVAYGSKRGGTREIAEVIAEVLLGEGVDAELADAAEVRSVDGYDAAIVGGALYMNRWHRDAHDLLVAHTEVLQTMPVWLFSSGPLDVSADDKLLPPTAQVAGLMERVGARGHVMFGGRLEPDAKGFIASAMAKSRAGDWRAWHLVRAWARGVARQLLDEEPRKRVTVERPPAPPRVQRYLLAALCLFVGLTAIGGGITLVLHPDGSAMNASPEMLKHSPFTTFLIPGLLLLFVVGFGNAIAGGLAAFDARHAPYVAFLAGAALLVWIVVQMIMVRPHHWLQLVYLATAILILIEARNVLDLRVRHGRSRPQLLGSMAKSR